MLLLQHFTKQCSKCHTVKELIFFHKSKGGRNGVRTECIMCNKEMRKEYLIENRDKILAKSRENYKKNRDKRAEYNKEYHRLNKEKIAERKVKTSAIYYKENKEKLNEKNREFNKSEAGKAFYRNKHYKRRLKEKEGNATAKDILKLQQSAKHCYWCNKKVDASNLHIDHYIPLAKGGEHDVDNLVVSCAKCNITKRAKDPIVFANSIGKLF